MNIVQEQPVKADQLLIKAPKNVLASMSMEASLDNPPGPGLSPVLMGQQFSVSLVKRLNELVKGSRQYKQ